MTTDERITQCYEDMKKSVNSLVSGLSNYENSMSIINKAYMLGKFELWMAEDLERLGLTNTKK